MKTKTVGFGIFSMLLWAVTAVAAESTLSCEEDAMCGPLVERARASSNAGQLDDALRSYQAAYALVLDPQLLFNVARVQHKLGRLKEAVDSYQRFLDSNYPDQALRERTAEFLARAKEQLPPSDLTVEKKPIEAAPGPVAAQPSRPTPIHKRPWFLALVGGGVASVLVIGLAGGIAGGVAASREPPSAPSGALTSHPFGP